MDMASSDKHNLTKSSTVKILESIQIYISQSCLDTHVETIQDKIKLAHPMLMYTFNKTVYRNPSNSYRDDA
jgi:hypothetical protein